MRRSFKLSLVYTIRFDLWVRSLLQFLLISNTANYFGSNSLSKWIDLYLSSFSNENSFNTKTELEKEVYIYIYMHLIWVSLISQ